MAPGFIGIPRGLFLAEVSHMGGYREMAERMTARAIDTCPVGERDDESGGEPHLKDTLVYKLITGEDPRILIGTRTQGDKLGYVTKGTEPHPIDPKAGSVLRFTSGGTVVFAAHVDHPGHPEPNTFLMDAAKAIAQEHH